MPSSGKDRFEKKFGSEFAELNADVNVVFNKKKREFYDWHAQNLAIMERIQSSYANLLSLMTTELPSGSPKVGSRVKDRGECVRKFEIKYRTDAEKTTRDQYHIHDYITDMIGVRIICLYEDDVPAVHEVIKENFAIIETTDKTKILEEDHEKFGYKGLHLNLKLNTKRERLPEYKGFQDFSVEVQIRSIVQDAWSEVDHRLKYKKSIPNQLKHRIIRIAALFELADQEFTYIRKDTETLETLLGSEELESGRQIDSFSFIAVMKKHFSNYNFDNRPESESANKIDGFVQQIGGMDPELTDEEFKNIMDKYVPKMLPYQELKNALGFRMNPFTFTRHVLYWHDKSTYGDALFEAQRTAFDSWLKENPMAD